MEWKEIEKGLEYELSYDDEKFVATVRQMSGGIKWVVSASPFFATWIEATSPEEAMWLATLSIYNNCNQMANHFHRIRDHLPNTRNLAEKADRLSAFFKNKRIL